MQRVFSSTQKAYLAGFLDGDGSIYVQAKPNSTYRYGFQVAPYVVLYQSSKDRARFEKVCALVDCGYVRERRDGILEYIIGKAEDIQKFLDLIEPYVILKEPQVALMRKILKTKSEVREKKDFATLMKLIDTFRSLNYSKKRKVRTLTP